MVGPDMAIISCLERAQAPLGGVDWVCLGMKIEEETIWKKWCCTSPRWRS